jgi:hypothetical protein
MAKIQLSQAERDLIGALCEAAAEYQFHGLRPMNETLRELTRDDFPMLQALADRITVPEDPPSHVIKLNW